MVLSNPEGASLDDDTGKGTITDDDEPPELAIDDAPAVVEGGTAEFVVRLSAVSGVAVTVDFDGGRDGAGGRTTRRPRAGSASNPERRPRALRWLCWTTQSRRRRRASRWS